MTEAARDTARALAAAHEIIDGRDLQAHSGAILVTTEHTIATLLLVIMGSPDKAAKMLNEGLLQGVEERLALYTARKTT